MSDKDKRNLFIMINRLKFVNFWYISNKPKIGLEKEDGDLVYIVHYITSESTKITTNDLLIDNLIRTSADFYSSCFNLDVYFRAKYYSYMFWNQGLLFEHEGQFKVIVSKQ